MVSFHTFAIILFSVLIILPTTAFCFEVPNPTSYIGNHTLKCLKVEREALLIFKESLTDPLGRLASWVGDDCCNWIGVDCEDNTGHVIKLDLRNSFPKYDDDDADVKYPKAYENSGLKGKINSSLLDLKHLFYLDLSVNDFSGSTIPKFLGSLKSLKYLNLSFSHFSQDIPPHLGNLSSLEYLDLNSFWFSSRLRMKSLKWLIGLTSLKYLNLGGATLEKVQNWFKVINMVPSLLELHLPRCGLNSFPPSIYLANITSLIVLDLSHNYFDSQIPHWLSNMTELSTINLKNCSLRGAIPNGMGYLPNLCNVNFDYNFNLTGKVPSSFSNLCTLQTISLQYTTISGEITELINDLSQCSNNISGIKYGHLNSNRLPRGKLSYLFKGINTLETINLFQTSIKGSIPNSIGNLSSLQTLDLSYCEIKGAIPLSIGKLSKLVSLQLGGNSWEGFISETHFQNLTQLKFLRLGTMPSTNSSLVLNIKHDWVPPFKLKEIYLNRMQVGPKFPLWLKTQTKLEVLSLQNGNISDSFPYGIWKSCSNIIYWSLSDNKLQGRISHLQFPPSIDVFDLSFNNFKGQLPIFPSNLSSIDLSNNMFSTMIPKNINKLVPKLVYLDLSYNPIFGRIPHSIGMLKELGVLVLRNVFLSGKLPSHWKDLQNLTILDLENNNISGNLPKSMQHLNQLETFSLHQNNFQAEIPSFFRNFISLTQLDLGENKFFGKLPKWIGESLSNLLRLNLRSNFFHGEIPQELCLLSRLQILDIGDNEFSGAIPPCIGNLSSSYDNHYGFINQMKLVWRGREDVYNDFLLFNMFFIDLSQNNLSGEIPENITTLFRLVNLNLSRNHLSGRIPRTIGNLRVLESLDLSKNELFSHIPESLSHLNFLNHLNLSFNNLYGRIPQGNQLQTLNDFSIYQGNPLLCGPPLLVNCYENESNPKAIPMGKNGIELSFFYIGMIVGFIVGFWGVCCTLIIKTSWRQTYFGYFENLQDKIIAFIMVKVVCLVGKAKGERNGAHG